MKRILSFSLCVLLLLNTFIMSSCKGNSGKEKVPTVTQAVESESVVTDKAEENNLNEGDTVQHYLTDSSADNLISIELPLLCEKDEALKAVVSDYLKNRIYELCGEEFDYIETDAAPEVIDYNNCFIELNYRTVYESDDFISLIFEGFYNKKMTAHPINMFFTLNIDRATNERIILKDVYEADSRLYALFSQYVFKNLEEIADPQWLEAFDISDLYDEQSFLDVLQDENEICSYFTEDSLGISCSVPHVMGDHLEIEIPYSELM